MQKSLNSKINLNIFFIILTNFLLGESARILDEFKQNLKISISKIELQLKEKIDKVTLDNLGKQMDGKYVPEIEKKIDKKDLKRNNSQINKKVNIK